MFVFVNVRTVYWAVEFPSASHKRPRSGREVGRGLQGGVVVDGSADSELTARLLHEAQAGESRAVERLLLLHEPFVRRFVELHLDPQLRGRIDAADVVQDTQLEALRRFPAYLAQPALPVRLWLRQLAHDRLIMVRRRHLKAARRSVARELPWPDRSSLLLARQLLASGSSPSRHATQRELAERVRQAVGRLAAIDRDVLTMRTFEGLSFEEVACLLEIDAAAARKRHGRAL